MKKNSEIYSLIKSLTKNEKRFFKIFSERHNKNKEGLKYIILFDIYDKMKVYDKNNFTIAIKAQQLNNIRYLKHQLYQQILRSLNIYAHNKNVEFQIQNLLINTQILFDKGLFKQSKKTLEKAKNLAKQYDLHLFMLMCFEKEKIISREQFDKNAISFLATDLLKIEQAILKQYSAVCEFSEIRSKLNLSSISDNEKDKLKEKEINSFKLQLNAIETSKNRSFSSQETELIIKSLIAIYHQDYNKLLLYLKEREQLYEQNPNQIIYHELNYLSIKYNLLVTYLNLKKYKGIEQVIKLIDSYRNKPTTKIVALKLFNYLNAELNFYNQKGNFTKSVSYEPEILKGLVKHGTAVHVYAKASIYIYLSVAFLGLKKHHQSRFWAEKVLNELSLPKASSPVITGNILAITNAFEEKKYTYLNWLTKQTIENLSKEKNTLKNEMLLFSFFSDYDFNKKDEKEIKMLFTAFKEKLTLIESNEKEPILEAFDFITWLNSQIIGQSFNYLTQLKYNKNNLKD